MVLDSLKLWQLPAHYPGASMYVEASLTTFARKLFTCFLVDVFLLSTLPSVAAAVPWEPGGGQAPAATAPAAGQQVTLAANGAPLAGADVALVLANMNKVSLGTTDSQGKTSPALDLANAAPGNPGAHLAHPGPVALPVAAGQWT